MAKEKKSELARSMPNNLEIEQAILGCVLIDPEVTINIVSKVKPYDFYSETHKIIYEAMLSLYNKNITIDILTLTDQLERKGQLASIGGVSYLTTLTNVVPSSASHENYITILRRDSISRQLIEVCGQVIDKAYTPGETDDPLAIAEKSIFEIAERGQVSTLDPIKNALSVVIENLEEIHKEGGVLRGLTTGFYKLDDILNGLHKSDLIVVAARPGVGKTSLAMNIVTNAALEANAKCACFSLEMGAEQLAQRMLFSVANVNMGKGMKGELDQTDWTKIWKANKKLLETNIFIDDNSLNTPSAILSKCRKLKREKGLDLIMIDYLQLMDPDVKVSGNRQAEISEISRKLKILAKEINVPVIVLSQLKRETEQRKRPILSDLRESGAIEQDADIVIFISKNIPEGETEQKDSSPQDYTAELIIAKHRSGTLGSVFVGWKGSRVSFVNLADDANTKSIVDAYNEQHAPKTEFSEPAISVQDLPDDADIF